MSVSRSATSFSLTMGARLIRRRILASCRRRDSFGRHAYPDSLRGENCRKEAMPAQAPPCSQSTLATVLR